ncbi:hypothetical protein [Streptomyces griseosporeus]|uniref:hypothetical protein n=1 Tax=Streptomyces griseosporeus TaxID=1910 RepID=UPI00167F1605|nr:hypothetical protein GCM10018783_68050 [Streptomyces griseosporeus]
MTAQRWTQQVRHQLGLGRLVALGGPGDGAWLAENAAETVLRRAAAGLPGVRLGRVRLALAHPETAAEPAVPPPPSALPPGALRVSADLAATAAEPLPLTASRVRVTLTRAAEHLGLAVTEVDLRVTDLLETEQEPSGVAGPEAGAVTAPSGVAGPGSTAPGPVAGPGSSAVAGPGSAAPGPAVAGRGQAATPGPAAPGPAVAGPGPAAPGPVAGPGPGQAAPGPSAAPGPEAARGPRPQSGAEAQSGPPAAPQAEEVAEAVAELVRTAESGPGAEGTGGSEAGSTEGGAGSEAAAEGADSYEARVRRAALAVPGVTGLTGFLGRAVHVGEGPHPVAALPRRHVRVELAVAGDHRAVDVARAVRAAVTEALEDRPTVAVLVTSVS